METTEKSFTGMATTQEDNIFNIENRNIENRNIENRNIENRNIENRNIENRNIENIENSEMIEINGHDLLNAASMIAGMNTSTDSINKSGEGVSVVGSYQKSEASDSEESSSGKSVNTVNTATSVTENSLQDLSKEISTVPVKNTVLLSANKDGLVKKLSISSLFGKKKEREAKQRVIPESPSPVQSYITSTVTSITSQIDAEIVEWLDQFKKYSELETRCRAGIAELNSIKINLERLIGRQKKDDALFYQSIIENSYFFLENSLRIRRSKFIRDMLAISSLIETYKHIKINPKPVNIDSSSFTAITNDIKDIYEEIERAKRNSSTLSWVKDDQISTLQEIEKDMSETLTYHTILMEYFEKLVYHELNFYK